MFRISISGLVFLIGMMSGIAQRTVRPDDNFKTKKEYLNPNEDYTARTLKLDEINFVSGYYSQNGNHSAVTGGIGTEKLTDLSNTFELKLLKNTKRGSTHHFIFGMGFDTYTSASSDRIDTAITYNGTNQGSTGGQSNPVIYPPPRDGHHGHSGASTAVASGPTIIVNGITTVTSASYRDQRYYPSLNWSMETPKGLTMGAGVSYSGEYDYFSKGLSFNIGKSSKNKNSDISLSVSAFFDHWLVIYPAELRPVNYPYGSERDKELLTKSPRNTYNTGLVFNQVINKRLQVGLMIEPSYQEGLLGTTYQRVYFENGTAKPEQMPDRRLKLPIGLRASWFIGDQIVVRPYYRYYQDDWGLHAHTASLEASIKASPFVSLIPFARYYTQNGVPYFAPYKMHSTEEAFYTSDYDLSKLSSKSFGLGLRMVPKNGVMDIPAFKSLELRFAHYIRSTDLKSNIITAALTFK
ncbi:MAG: DUF3570 domain-containing protein [Saprospiraceae bacterium]